MNLAGDTTASSDNSAKLLNIILFLSYLILHNFIFLFFFIRFHGYNGYLDVATPPYATPLRDCFLKAGQELGYDLVDYNSDKLIGFSAVQANLRNGHRVSANKAFLRPIRDRKNFYLSKFSTVTKIIIHPETKQALGVQFIKNHKTYFVSATKEIILCAGIKFIHKQSNVS